MQESHDSNVFTSHTTSHQRQSGLLRLACQTEFKNGFFDYLSKVCNDSTEINAFDPASHDFS